MQRRRRKLMHETKEVMNQQLRNGLRASFAERPVVSNERVRAFDKHRVTGLMLPEGGSVETA